MAHRIPKEVMQPGFNGRRVAATTETGGILRGHTLEDVEFALTLLAFNGGNRQTTSAQLESEYGIVVHPQTLGNWSRRSFAQRYVQIQQELKSEISKRTRGTLTEFALQAAEAQSELLHDLMEKKEDIPASQLAASLRNVSQAANISIEKAQLLANEPTSIVKHTPDEALKFLSERGIFIEGEAEEETSEEED